ncbi:MAG TPA: GyrI-like domain-containing protein [Xanthobacteraceae bacterium]|jgi:AraC family transcriptional regulator
MNAPRSRDVYADRMHRVTGYVDQHLDQFLDLETLAEVAHFSPFHFHRLFSALMGETLGAYLRRRRCEVAATRLLAQPRLSVLQIALGVGFGSAEAFTHAFGARFGCSPTTWRLQQAAERAAISNPDQANSKPDQDHRRGAMKNGVSIKTEAPMKVQIIERKPTPIAYLRHVGPYGQPISMFWQTQAYPWMVTNGLIGQPRYGISHDDPRVTAPEQCRYDAGCEIPANLPARGDAHRTTIPGGQYAALSFKGVVSGFEPAWDALLRDWLPSSGLQLDNRPMFEYYPTDSRYDPSTGVLECQLCVPVMPL